MSLWPIESGYEGCVFSKEEAGALASLVAHPGWAVAVRLLNAMASHAVSTAMDDRTKPEEVDRSRGRYRALVEAERLIGTDIPTAYAAAVAQEAEGGGVGKFGSP